MLYLERLDYQETQKEVSLTSMYFELLLAAFCAYSLLLVTYRRYLSPIAKFPGPKLAAISWWYEFYYEVVLRGQFTFHISELHKKYGNSELPHER